MVTTRPPKTIVKPTALGPVANTDTKLLIYGLFQKGRVLAQDGEPESETRKRSDQILKHVISPALRECGYTATRADQISEPGMITSQVIQHIVDDELVVADLTERNPNVFYELAIRHAIRKPLVQLIKRGEQIPFDVAGTRTIHVDHHDLDNVEEAKKDIIAQVRSLEKDPSRLETPISVSLDLQLLKQSDNPEQRSLADVLSVISELRNSVANMEKRLESPDGFISRDLLRFLEDRILTRSHRSRTAITEMRHILEETIAVIEESGTLEVRKDLEVRMMRLRKLLNMLIHEDQI